MDNFDVETIKSTIGEISFEEMKAKYELKWK